jgi:pre-mRNA-processing factor 40
VSKKLKEDKDSLFCSTEPLEQISAFEEYVKGIERQEFQQKKLEKRRQERKNREAFTLMIEELLQKREITHETKWVEFVKTFREDPRYFNLIGQAGSTPHEIFDDALNEERDILNMHKAPFKALIKANGIRFPSTVSFELFDTDLQRFPEYQ